ncbi:5-oxoprolinase subunit B family protein [Plantibacter flavus]|uniref:5-oxoprolinase subunit B family protein n=1 Tax=Plantibacter flavus TaxID=150123 RepID=UPI001F0AF7BA|nr:carboxyltransferase domain-containing protein [Plantibacter flavus]
MVNTDTSSGPVLRAMGEEAVLLELGSLEDVLLVHRALAASRPAGLVDLVPAARTVLAVTDARGPALAAVGTWLLATAERALAPGAGGSAVAVEEELARPDVVIHVRYDGPDLRETAELLGMEAADLIAWHTARAWTVAFSGFAPGFAYLVPEREDEMIGRPLEIPRLSVPRTTVPAGSVALAGTFSGVYPRASPGGWRIIGTTDAVLWEDAADPPALLVPGGRVRFVQVAA